MWAHVCPKSRLGALIKIRGACTRSEDAGANRKAHVVRTSSALSELVTSTGEGCVRKHGGSKKSANAQQLATKLVNLTDACQVHSRAIPCTLPSPAIAAASAALSTPPAARGVTASLLSFLAVAGRLNTLLASVSTNALSTTPLQPFSSAPAW